jgi:hypothetical protein
MLEINLKKCHLHLNDARVASTWGQRKVDQPVEPEQGAWS